MSFSSKMLKYIFVIVVLGFNKGYATTPKCNLLQHSQLAALNERMNQMIQALYSSPFLSSIAKTKSSLRTQQSSNDYEPYTPPYQPEPYPSPPPFPIPSFSPSPASPPNYPQLPPENSNAIYISPKTAASPPSVTISRTKYPPADYRYPVEYQEEYLPSKAVDPEVQRQEYYRAYYQHPASTANPSAAETPARDYSYYYPEAERPVRYTAAAAAQPSYLPPAPGALQVPVTSSYPAPVRSGYVASPNVAYTAPPCTGYAAPPSTGYAAQPSARYAAPPSAGYAAPPNTGYAAPPSAGYATPPSTSYATPIPSNPSEAASPYPTYSSPVSPNTAYAAPVLTSPAYAAPIPTNPAYAAPVPGNPAYATPVPASPPYPSEVPPAYAAPVPASAAYATSAPSPPYSPQAYAGQEYFSGYYAQ